VKRTGKVYPRVGVDSGPCRAVGQAGGLLLTRAVDVTGLGGALSTRLARWHRWFAVHDPGKITAPQYMSELARRVGMSRDGLYKALSAEGNPTWTTVLKVTNALGLRLTLHAVA